MMKKHEKQAYLEAIRKRYRKAKRCDKNKVLDEFCAVCGYHRKYVLRRLNEAKKQATRKKPGKPSRYDCAEVMVPLRAVWLATDQMASKRLKVAIPHYEAMHGEMANEARHKLLAMASATIDRLLAPVRVQTGNRGWRVIWY